MATVTTRLPWLPWAEAFKVHVDHAFHVILLSFKFRLVFSLEAVNFQFWCPRNVSVHFLR